MAGDGARDSPELALDAIGAPLGHERRRLQPLAVVEDPGVVRVHRVGGSEAPLEGSDELRRRLGLGLGCSAIAHEARGHQHPGDGEAHQNAGERGQGRDGRGGPPVDGSKHPATGCVSLSLRSRHRAIARHPRLIWGRHGLPPHRVGHSGHERHPRLLHRGDGLRAGQGRRRPDRKTTAAGPSTSSTTPAATGSSPSGTCTMTRSATSTPPSRPAPACRHGSTTWPSMRSSTPSTSVASAGSTRESTAWRSTTGSAGPSTPWTRTGSSWSGAPTSGPSTRTTGPRRSPRSTNAAPSLETPPVPVFHRAGARVPTG